MQIKFSDRTVVWLTENSRTIIDKYDLFLNMNKSCKWLRNMEDKFNEKVKAFEYVNENLRSEIVEKSENVSAI